MNSEHDEILDSGLIADIPKFRELFEEKAQFHWQFYSELPLLRSKIYDKLKSSLLERPPLENHKGWGTSKFNSQGVGHPTKLSSLAVRYRWHYCYIRKIRIASERI